MRIFILIILFFNFFKYSSLAQVQLNESGNSFSADGSIFLIAETQKPLSIKDALRLYTNGNFKPVITEGNAVNLGFTRFVYWIVIPIDNPGQKSIAIDAGVANAGVYRLECYVVNRTGEIKSFAVTGKKYNFTSRTIRNRHYYFPVVIPPDSSCLIFFRADCRGNGFHLPIRLLKPAYRLQSEQQSYIVYAFLSGILLFVAIFSFVSFLWSRDSVYFYYTLNVLSCCLFFLADGDLDVEWLYPNLAGWATIAPVMYSGCILFFMLLFTSSFLQLKENNKLLAHLSRLFMLLVVVLMIMVPVSHLFFQNMLLQTITYYYGVFCFAGGWIFQLCSIYSRIRDRYRPAYLYGVAILPVLFSLSLYLLNSFNIQNNVFLPFNYMLCGFTIEIIFLSFALIYSHNFHRQKHLELSNTLSHQQLQFSKQLLSVQEDEQKRIARDLHDELGGNLAAIKMTLQSFQLPTEQSQLVTALIDKASDNTRGIAHNLMPPEFEETGLDIILDNHYQRLNTDGMAKFHFHSSGADHHFDKQEELMIYRMVMELTNNIIRHSQASEATLQLVYHETHLEIMAEDNGKGFTAENAGGMGLKNIRSRTQFLDGSVTIDSGPNGTTIIIQIPYKHKP